MALTRILGGFLVALEGIDGAGKTTISTLLAQYCGERGVVCLLSKEPTSLKWGQELRRSASAGRLTLERELELFVLDRRDHVERSIRPALDAGSIVLLDRYYWSSAAYQGGRGADPKQILARNEAFAPIADLTLVLDIEVTAGLERIRRRGDTPNLFEDQSALERARALFLDLVAQHPERSRRVDASASLREVAASALALFVAAVTEKVQSSDLEPEQRESTLRAVLGQE